jgi:hypothetical protein
MLIPSVASGLHHATATTAPSKKQLRAIDPRQSSAIPPI